MIDRWGPWVLNRKGLYLLHNTKDYYIDLASIVNAGEALDSIAQVSSKRWATAEDLGHLVKALDEIFHLQTNLCPWGVSRTIDAETVLHERFDN